MCDVCVVHEFMSVCVHALVCVVLLFCIYFKVVNIQTLLTSMKYYRSMYELCSTHCERYRTIMVLLFKYKDFYHLVLNFLCWKIWLLSIFFHVNDSIRARLIIHWNINLNSIMWKSYREIMYFRQICWKMYLFKLKKSYSCIDQSIYFIWASTLLKTASNDDLK